jgi:hypothetical protein
MTLMIVLLLENDYARWVYCLSKLFRRERNACSTLGG